MNEPFGTLNALATLCYTRSEAAGWWHDLVTAKPYGPEVKPVKIALMHSELSELLEAVRRAAPTADEHIPHLSSEEVELADILIRVFDYAGRFGLDIGLAVRDKMEYNAKREDHRVEQRLLANGKKF